MNLNKFILFEEVQKMREKHKRKRTEMPKERKDATLDRIFDEFLNYLDEIEGGIEGKII